MDHPAIQFFLQTVQSELEIPLPKYNKRLFLNLFNIPDCIPTYHPRLNRTNRYNYLAVMSLTDWLEVYIPPQTELSAPPGHIVIFPAHLWSRVEGKMHIVLAF